MEMKHAFQKMHTFPNRIFIGSVRLCLISQLHAKIQYFSTVLDKKGFSDSSDVKAFNVNKSPKTKVEF